MKSFIKHLLVVLIVLLTQKAIAQSFPVSINTVIHSPYSAYLSDYIEPGSQKLQLNIQLNDPTLLQHPCKFRFTIEGVGITIRTRQNFTPQPTIIQGGGVPNLLYGEDLAEYFNPGNLDFAGISKSDYIKGAKLSEGVYRFTVEVLDYNRSTVLSNKGTAVAWIILNDPVLLNLPRTGDKVKITEVTNIPFTWTPRHTGSPNAAFSVEYVFKLVEIWPATRNPNDAFLSQQPLYETTTTVTQIVYGPSEPALIPGRKYAWQVQAKDTEDRDLFKNDGKSEVYVFQFGDAIGAPQNFHKEGGNSSVLNLRWEPAPNGAIPQQYRVRYRKKNDRDRDVWYESVTPQLWIAVPDLQRDTEYEMQIRAESALQYSEYSPSTTFKTSAADPVLYECGKEDVPVPVNTSSVLMGLPPGTILTVAGHKIKVIQATGSNGDFTGEGWMYLSYLKGAGVRITFSGQVNNDYEFTNLTFETVYNKGSVMAQAADDANNIGNDTNPFFEKKDSAVIVKPDYTISGTIASVSVKDDGKIVVVDTEGNESTFEPKKDERTGKAKETVIADAAGNSYTVGADGKVTKKEGSAGVNGAASVQPDPVKDRIIVLILEQFEEEIAAWLRNNGKGGDIDDDLLLATELPACFKREAGQLKYFKDRIIPYYKEHPAELRGKIETSENNKKLFNNVAGHFKNTNDVDWSKVPADEQEGSRNATGLALMDRIAPLVQFYDKAAPSLQTDDYRKWLAKVKAIYNFFKTCSNEDWESYQDEGIVPYCFWRDQNVSASAYYSNGDIPFTSGLIDGAYREADGAYHLPELVRNVSKFPGKLIYSYTLAYWKCTPEKLVANAEQYEYVLEQLATMEEEGGLWNWVKEHDYKEEKESLEQYFADCRDANEIREGVEELHYIVTNWDEIEKLYSQVSQRISAYFSTLENTDNIGRYERGRLIVPVVSTALTLGGTAATKIEEIKNILKSLRTASEGSWKKVTEEFGKALAKGLDNISAKLYRNNVDDILNDTEYFPSISGSQTDDVIFDLTKLDKICKSLEKQGVAIWKDEDAERFLKQMGAEAMYWDNLPGSPGTLVFPRKPTRAQVIEELKHLGQHRQRLWTEAGGYENVIKIEIKTQNELIDFAKKRNWNPGEIKKLEDALDYWKKELQAIEN